MTTRECVNCRISLQRSNWQSCQDLYFSVGSYRLLTALRDPLRLLRAAVILCGHFSGAALTFGLRTNEQWLDCIINRVL